jgi:hypothetical protein
MTFDPSLSGSGAPYTRAPYALGDAGIRQSLEAMCSKMREGRVDPRVIGWTGKVLGAAGLDGRSRSTTVAGQVGALLSAYRSETIYAPDPYGVELVQSAAATLCLAPGLCLRRGDCDDGVVALGSATLSLGIPTMIVKQTFGTDAQEHVLLGVHDGSDWRYADPSTNLPFGSAVSAETEVWIDPMEPLGALPASQPEIVTLGAIRTLGRIPGVGVGTLFGYPTVDDLVKLLNVAAYDLEQIQTAVSACSAANGGFSDPTVWAAWQADLQQTNVDFNAATQASAEVINSTPHWLQGVNVITYQWGMVRAVIDSCIDLDRRWRVGSSCAAPTYPNTPQPTVSGDVDQWTYNAANSAVKGIESAARNATQPMVIAVGGLAAGLALAVAAAVGLNLLIPVRR